MNPSNSMVLETRNLSKAYKGVQALQDFNLKLTPGILGLLGPNGAGKSTLMRMLATITKPTEGIVLWNGQDVVKDPEALRAVLGYLPQDFGVYPNLSAQEFLEYMAAIKGMSGEQARRKISDLLDLVNLRDAARRPLGGYSGGMRQRVGIAQALLNDPQLLIVDEPTVGLDPEERVRFRNLLSDLSGERIVILSTHIVSDVESTATDIAIIHKGHLKVRARPEQLLKQMEGSVWEWMATSQELPALKQQFLVSGTLRRMDGVEVRAVCEARPCPEAQPVTPNLEDVYLSMVAQRQGGAGMNTMRILYHLAMADFYERARRYSFLLTLAAVIYMGVLVNNGTLFFSLRSSDPNLLASSYQGEFNSAWISTMTVLVLNSFLGLFGFYLVSDCIKRDIRTGVGQIIATTPVSRAVYLVGKWISNCLVLFRAGTDPGDRGGHHGAA